MSTRAQAKKDALEHNSEEQSGSTHPEESDEQTGDSAQDLQQEDFNGSELPELAHLFPFEDDVVQEPGPSRPRLTREARRRHNQDYVQGPTEANTARLIREQEAGHLGRDRTAK